MYVSSKFINQLKILLLLVAIVIGFLLLGFLAPVQAEGFGTDIGNYYCEDGSDPIRRSDGFFCDYGTVERRALLRPPPLTILQIWFVRILYIVWGASGVFFTFVLITIGIQYMLSFGNEIAVGDVIKRFQNWLFGLALTFLGYPVLATLFALLPLSNSTCYADIEMPAFQFFFPTACVSVSEAEAAAREACIESCDRQRDAGAISLTEYNNLCVPACGSI